MDEVNAVLRHFVEEVRLLLDRDSIEGFRRWSELYTELVQRGLFELCDEMLHMVKGFQLPPHGLGIIRYSEGWMYDRRGRWVEAVNSYEAALKAFDNANIPLETQILLQIGSLYQDQGDWPKAQDAYDRALALATADHDRALIFNNLGGLCSLRDEPTQARHHFEQAKAILDGTDDRYNYAATCVGLGGVLRDEGNFQGSVDQLVEAITIFQNLGDVKGMATTVASLALTYYTAGRLPESAANYHTALDLFVSINDRSNIARTLANLALTSAGMDKKDEAIGYLEQAVAEYREIGELHGHNLAIANIQKLMSDPHSEPGLES